MGDGIIHVQFYGNHFSFLVAFCALAVCLIEVTEKCFPCLSGIRLSCQLHHGFVHHSIGFLLVVPPVFGPQSCSSVPLGHSWIVYPCHTAWMDASPLSDGLVGLHKQFGSTAVEITKKEAVAVHGLVQHLDCRGGTEVWFFPRFQLPNDVSVFIYLHSLYRCIECVHCYLVPFVVPVVDEVVPVFESYCLLRLCHAQVCGVHFPHGLSHTVYFLNVPFTPCDE